MKRFNLILSVILTGLIFSCSNMQANQNTPLEETLPQPDIYAFTDEMSTYTASATISPTLTQVPTRTTTQTSISISTLTTNNQEEAVEFLFTTNNFCDLPCWWGIMPGGTAWVEAEEFLTPLVLEIDQRVSSRFNGMVVHEIEIEVPTSIDGDGIESIGILENTDGLIYWISFSTTLSAMGFDISSFLARYGPPSEVFIWATGYASLVINEGRYSVAFYYETRGILVQFYGNAFMGDEVIEICSSEYLDDNAFWLLWDPYKHLSFETVGIEAESVIFSPLTEISDLTISTLYEQLVESRTHDYCFEIENPGYLN